MSQSHESESSKAARNVPPLGRERKLASDNGGLGSTLAYALPLVISVGGAVAAGMAAEKKNHAVSRAAGRARDAAGHARDEAESWYETLADKAGSIGESVVDHGAKLAGVTGLLSALGSGGLSSAASTAAKALTAKKIAEYAASAGTSATKRAGRFAKDHPALTAAGSAAALRARGYAHDGADYAREAYYKLGGRRPKPESHMADNLATGLAVLGVGAAAMYLFHPDQGRHRRRVLRETLFGAGQQTAERSKRLMHDAQKRAAHYANEARQQAEHYGEVAKERLRGAKEQAESAVDAAKAAVRGDEADTSKSGG